MLTLPLLAAQCKGVEPLLHGKLMSAPTLISQVTISDWPCCTAEYNKEATESESTFKTKTEDSEKK